jgi:hypothetical protein
MARLLTRHPGRDIAFDVPENWEDRTVTAYSAPPQHDHPVTPNIVVTRDFVTDRQPVGSYADRQMVDLAKRLNGFNLLSRAESQLGGEPTVVLDFVWNGQFGPVRQKQIFVLRDKTVLTLVLTALASEFAAQEPTFNAILTSVAFS